jgi:RHS repeat-associated protein
VKYFDGDYEEDSSSVGHRKYHYIQGGNGLTAIFVMNGSGNDTMYYVLSDHLGSMTNLVNASTGQVESYSFNAWGMPRDASNWTLPYTGELFAGRGFTGHEHLMDFNLINMNGRIYDPILGRFLSPDPYVQSPGYPNNYNRYTYALNNPLKFTDPSGYSYNKPSDWEREQRDGEHTYYNYELAWKMAGMMGSQFSDAQRGPSYAEYSEWASSVQGNPIYNEKNQSDFFYYSMMGYRDPLNLNGALEYAHEFLALSLSKDFMVISPYGVTDGKTPFRMVEEAMMLQDQFMASSSQFGLLAYGGGDGPWTTTLTFAAAASLADGPLPFGEAIGLAAIGATAIYQLLQPKLYEGGNPNYPGPWYTDRPNNYIPPPVPGFNNRNYFPNGNGNNFIKWTIRLGGAAVLGKRLYEAFSIDEQYLVVPQDNTFIQPTPFLTPIPDPYKGY